MMPRRALLLSLLLCCVPWSLAIRAQAPSAPAAEPLASIDAYVADVLRSFEVPGLALAIVKDGRVVLARGYGRRAIDGPEAVRCAHTVRHRLKHEGVHGDGARRAGRRR